MMFILNKNNNIAINSERINTVYIKPNLIGDKICDFDVRCTASDGEDYLLNKLDTEKEAIEIMKNLIERL